MYNVHTDINRQTRNLMASFKSLAKNQILQYKLTSLQSEYINVACSDD